VDGKEGEEFDGKPVVAKRKGLDMWEGGNVFYDL